MVLEVVDFLGDIGDHLDIVTYSSEAIEEGKIGAVHDRLTDIHNIGQKKAALYLRDLVTIKDLEEGLAWEEYRYVFPVDTQVKQVATEIGIVDEGVNTDTVIEEILDACLRDVSPVEFNQGAWYVGAHAFDVVMSNLSKVDPPPQYYPPRTGRTRSKVPVPDV